MNTEQYRSIQYLADQLGLPHHTIRWWIRIGKLQTIKIGKRILIPQAAIDALIAEAKQGNDPTTEAIVQPSTNHEVPPWHTDSAGEDTQAKP